MKRALMPLIQGKNHHADQRVDRAGVKDNIHLLSLEPSGVVDGKMIFISRLFLIWKADAAFKDLGLFLMNLRKCLNGSLVSMV